MPTEISYNNSAIASSNMIVTTSDKFIEKNIYYSLTYSTKFCHKYNPINYTSFHYSLKGSFIVEVEFPRTSFIINEGEIFIAKSNTSYTIKNIECQLTGIISLHIADEKFLLFYKALLKENGVFNKFYNTENELFAKPNFSNLTEYEHSLFRHLLDLLISKDLYTKIDSPEFLDLTFKHVLLLIDHNFKENQLKEDSIESIINGYIDDNLRSANLSELSKILHYNTSYTSELVSKITGNNFKIQLREARLKKAIRLLKNSSTSMEEICQAIGYENSSSFISAFKDKYGITPKEYRNKIILANLN